MSPTAYDDLFDLAARFATIAARGAESSFADSLTALLDSAEEVGLSWSGSSIGYHARIYYAGLQVPPPGARFSQEWGSVSPGRSIGDWREFSSQDVLEEIKRRASGIDISNQEKESNEARLVLHELQDEALSILSIAIRKEPDEYLQQLLDQVRQATPLTFDICLRGQLPSGQFMSRDMAALQQGLMSAPHQEVIANVIAIRSPFYTANELASTCRSAARHLQRLDSERKTESGHEPEGRIAIGHGHSPDWRALKDFIADRLQLPWDEFNRVTSAGIATTDRLQEMVDGCAAAFLIATAEDERIDGEMTARQNVIHEIGLFQGRLGFSRAIVLLEEGCAEFSNIHGLGQIRFPRGQISACFEEVRRVLEREGLLEGPERT